MLPILSLLKIYHYFNFKKPFILDTDDLSNETYKAVIITAEKFSHNLCLQFGVLASNCLDDNDYLIKATNLITA